MKQQTALSTISRWAAFPAAALGTVTLLLATPQMDPEGVVEVSEFLQMELYHDQMMNGSEISVEIEDGIATLTGPATSLAQAERAAAKVLTSPDVLTVVNMIKIAPQDETSILANSKRLLASLETVESSRINLKAEGSRIILEGAVGSIDEAELAREIVSETAGVTAVDNNLVIDFQSIRSNEQITAQLKYLFNDDPLFTGLDIEPVVTDGIVAWNGDVGSRGEFERIIRRSYVTGIMEVDASGVTINGDLAMEAVEDKDYTPSQSLEALQAAISHDPRLQNENISADMNQGVITLNGTVETVTVRDAAELTARCIPGVLSVSNKLSLSAGNEIAANLKDMKASAPPLITNKDR